MLGLWKLSDVVSGGLQRHKLATAGQRYRIVENLLPAFGHNHHLPEAAIPCGQESRVKGSNALGRSGFPLPHFLFLERRKAARFRQRIIRIADYKSLQDEICPLNREGSGSHHHQDKKSAIFVLLNWPLLDRRGSVISPYPSARAIRVWSISPLRTRAFLCPGSSFSYPSR